MATTLKPAPAPVALRRGQRVRVRPLSEIAETLDESGSVDSLPFMAEMMALSGQEFTVAARADKTCDTILKTGTTRQMVDTVHLAGQRCDGSAHGGCQATCLLFFKESWLEPVTDESDHPADGEPADNDGLREKLESFANAGPDVYRCQATQLLDATTELSGYGHYLTDLKTRNVSLGHFLHSSVFSAMNAYQRRSDRLPRFMRLADGHRFPRVRGRVRGANWPEWQHLDLQVGDLVEVRSREEVEATLDENQRNRGLWFDAEMLRLCGRRGRVLKRVERIIDERTGRMLRIKKDTVIVEGMISCDGLYHNLCTRSFVAFMREAWLKRVE